MTREDALEQLRLGPGINEDVSGEYNDAVDMAIEVLKQDPKTMNNVDIISKLQELCEKYLNDGLEIEIDFRRWSMVIRGVWKIPFGETYVLNTSYDYNMLYEILEHTTIDDIFDTYYKRFKEKIEKGEIKCR